MCLFYRNARNRQNRRDPGQEPREQHREDVLLFQKEHEGKEGARWVFSVRLGPDPRWPSSGPCWPPAHPRYNIRVEIVARGTAGGRASPSPYTTGFSPLHIHTWHPCSLLILVRTGMVSFLARGNHKHVDLIYHPIQRTTVRSRLNELVTPKLAVCSHSCLSDSV